MKIIKDPDPILRQKCEPVRPLPLLTVHEMFMLLREHRGLGLAAPQVGIAERFFVTCWGELFVNPVIEAFNGVEIDSREGCLSIPGKQFIVKRHQEVVVMGKRYIGEMAIVIQHEIHHLDGILISDLGTPV